MPQVPTFTVALAAPEATPPTPKRSPGPSLKATKLLSILVSKRIDLSDSRQLKVVRVILDEIKKDYPRFSTLNFLDKVQAAVGEISAKGKKLQQKLRTSGADLVQLKAHLEELSNAAIVAASYLRNPGSDTLVTKVFIPITDTGANKTLVPEFKTKGGDQRELAGTTGDIFSQLGRRSSLTREFVYTVVAPAISSLWLEKLLVCCSLYTDYSEYQEADSSTPALGIPEKELRGLVYTLVHGLLKEQIRVVSAKIEEIENRDNPAVAVSELIEAVVESWNKEGKN